MLAERPRFPVPALLFAVTGVLFVWSVLSSAPRLPDRVATHFSAQGEADGWMSAGQHVQVVIGAGLGLSLFLIGLCHLVPFLPSRLLNVPDADFWRLPGNYPEACRIVARWSWLVASLQLVFLGIIHTVVVAVNQLSPPRLSSGMLVWPVAIFGSGLGVLVWGLFRSLRRARAALGSPS